VAPVGEALAAGALVLTPPATLSVVAWSLAGARPVALARATPTSAPALPLRCARLLLNEPTGIGMPLARGGVLDGGVLLRAGLLAGAERADAGCRLGARGEEEGPAASFFGAGLEMASCRCSPRGKSTSASQSDGSGLPEPRLPEL
jgi:hypothetical protein